MLIGGVVIALLWTVAIKWALWLKILLTVLIGLEILCDSVD